MRADLDSAFQGAHAEVAGVIRELQQGGSARDAARARERLLALEAKAEAVERAQPPRTAEPRGARWTGAGRVPGDAVRGARAPAPARC